MQYCFDTNCRFDPVRFSNDDEELPNPLSYIPFAFAASRRTPENR